MNKIYIAGILINFLLPFHLYSQSPKKPVSTQNAEIAIAVIDFMGKNISAADASIVTDFIRTQMVNLGVFNVMDRNNMETILAEQKFQASGCTETECAVQIGKILNVHKMIVGSVSKLEGTYYVTASMIDVETGKIEISKTNQCYSASELKTSAEELVNQISGVKPAEKKKPEYPEPVKEERRPKIIDVMGNKITINRGRLDMIEKRQIFDIYSENIKIAAIKILDIYQEKSTGKILRRYNSVGFPKIGDTAIYTGRKFKVGGIGLTVGYVSGEKDKEWGGGGIYYEFVSPSGLGLQLNLTVYVQSYDEYWHDNYYSLWRDDSSSYSFPIILKYHLFYDTDFSPYIGLGMYYNSTNSMQEKYERVYDPSSGNYTYKYGDNWYEENSGISLVFNAGFELFTQKFCHLSGDIKFFLGKSTPHFNSNAFVLSPAVSFHW